MGGGGRGGLGLSGHHVPEARPGLLHGVCVFQTSPHEAGIFPAQLTDENSEVQRSQLVDGNARVPTPAAFPTTLGCHTQTKTEKYLEQ